MNQEEKENQALQAELEYRLQPIELNPQILQNVFKKTGAKPDKYVDFVNFLKKLSLPVQQFSSFLWERRRIGVSFATSVLVIFVFIKLLIPPEPEPRERSFPSAAQKLVVPNPQVTAQTLKTDLEKFGIVATVKKSDEDWIVEVINLSADNLKYLPDLLKKYKLKLPPPGENGLKVRIVAKGN